MTDEKAIVRKTDYIVKPGKWLANYEGKKYADGTMKVYIKEGERVPDEYSDETILSLLKYEVIEEATNENKEKKSVQVKNNNSKIKLIVLAKELKKENKELMNIAEGLLERRIRPCSWLTVEEAELIKGHLKNDSN
jgi:hypothetical protein